MQRIITWLVPIAISLVILALTPINTDLGARHFATMAALLLVALAIPYAAGHWHDVFPKVRYHTPATHWTRGRWGYLALTAVIAYLFVPWYLTSSGVYRNWHVQLGAGHLLVLFIGTMSLGAWDELFFVNTVYQTLRHHLRPLLANLIQAVLFTSFLYVLGFRSWGPLAIFPFTLLQGIIYERTHSLGYIIAIHLTIDFILFLALIHAFYPTAMPIFLT